MTIANTPQPSYYAVIFSAVMTSDATGYAEAIQLMRQLAEQQPGFLGMESAGEQFEVTVSYWESLESIRSWKQQTNHLLAQKLGQEKWYSKYKVRIAKVERDYSFENDEL